LKAVILAGGLGSRLSEETDLKPKPMVEIGGRPILWHIMKIYGHYGITDFVVALGYRGYVIKEFFANYFLHMSDVTFDLSTNTLEVHRTSSEPWRVTLVDTGEATLTGGRLKRLAAYLNDGTFLATYGDGVGNVDIDALIRFHRSHGGLATLTATQPPGRFGRLQLDPEFRVSRFDEHTDAPDAWINGGFFVLEPEMLDYIDGDDVALEGDPLRRLSAAGKLYAYRHQGFWLPMDTLRDRRQLEVMWDSGNAPWKVWS
jgi:glucose-1-phosphate cytidylyltransferase